MIKNYLMCLIVFGVILLSVMTGAEFLHAAVPAPPEPPTQNPHPPVTEVDKRRVAFAESAIRNVLMGEIKITSDPVQNKISADEALPAQVHQIKLTVNAQCLSDTACIQKNAAMQGFIKNIKNDGGIVTEIRHVHIIPWSMQKFMNARSTSSAKTTSGYSPNKSPQESHDHAAVTSMPVPQTEADEYLVHAYVKREDGHWHHLDVIVGESASGALYLRGFYIIPMPTYKHDLPDGVVC